MGDSSQRNDFEVAAQARGEVLLRRFPVVDST
jgi:hypothetical protein